MNINGITPLSDSRGWNFHPFNGIRLGDPYKNIREIVDYITDGDINTIERLSGTETNKNLQDFTRAYEALVNAQGATGDEPSYYDRNKTGGFVDSTAGGADGLNSHWQFGWDDDIVYDSARTATNEESGLGRVYSEMYNDTQHTLWLQFGVPQYRGLKNFYGDAGDPKLSRMMNSNDGSLISDLSYLFGKGVALAIKLPFLPFTVVGALVSNFSNIKITKYYDLKPAMPLYYSLVNGIISQLAVNMGLYAAFEEGARGTNEGSESGSNMDIPADLRSIINSNTDSGYVPEVLKKGPDIFKIIEKRSRLLYGQAATRKGLTSDSEGVNTDFMLDGQIKAQKNSSKNVDGERSAVSEPAINDTRTGEDIANAVEPRKEPGFIDWLGSVRNYATGAADWVAFRIEKGSDANESISNQVGESNIAGTLNSKVSSFKEKAFSFAKGKTGFQTVDAATGLAADFLSGLSEVVPGGGSLKLITGNGYFDIPEVWKNSSFVKTYSFDIQLRARLADRVSIYQNLYVPLAMLLAGACPRAVGKNSYTSPFVCRAYAKGQFSVSLGMIESLSIRRGADEFGWTYDKLPTSIDITISIKDLAPAFYLSLVSNGFQNIFYDNRQTQEYISTLSGIGIQERTWSFRSIKRRLAAASLMYKNTTFSSTYWGLSIGNTGFARIATELSFPRVWAEAGAN